MRRRFNYTDRSRIPQERISINLNRDVNSIKSFNAEIDLNDMNLPDGAKVYVEAYHKTEVSRYDFGLVRNIIPANNTDLANLAYSENMKFRILVVDEASEHGLILAHADRIKPTSDTDKKPILPVDFKNIGQQIWKVDFSGDEGSPALVINSNIPNIENIARSDPQFIMYVYPAVIRQVLTHMSFVDGVESSYDPPIEWHKDWLDFSKKIIPGDNPPKILHPKKDNFEPEEVKNWIDRIVEEFCAGRNEWNLYISSLMEEVA